MNSSLKILIVCASLAMPTFMAGISHAQNESVVLGFQSWKNNRVDEAKTTLERLNSQEKSSEKKSGKSSNKTARPDQKIQQAQINLELAQELTVNDYFVLYLSQFKQKDAFIEAAKKLSADETAELMMSYQKRLSGPDPVDVRGAPGLIGNTSIK